MKQISWKFYVHFISSEGEREARTKFTTILLGERRKPVIPEAKLQ
jgi:hypothetical protein